MSPNGPLEEAEIQILVRLAQEGDTRAFESLYEHFFTPVYRYTAFRVQPEVAEDLAADIFVKVWEKLHQYRLQKGVPFGAWLFRIARHVLIDSYRKEREWSELSDELPDPNDENRADTRARLDDTLRVVQGAMAKLPRRYREVLLLSYIAELPHSAIARILDMTEGGVRILKFRALRKLETLLPPEFRDHS